ncbi:MAG: TetR-like C-terminal domain-containing protein, partial [Chloroflexaceae bacterium]
GIAGHAADWLRQHGQMFPPAVLIAVLQAWALGHGTVALELNGQLQPIIGDAGEFFAYTVRSLLHTLGVSRGGT